MIDLQVNGAAGHDITADPSSIWAVGAALRAFGVDAFLPTLVSAPAAVVEQAQLVLAAGPPRDYTGAAPLGLHIEGPFLNPERAGAHDIGSLAAVDVSRAVDWSPDRGVRMVTLAPELPGALDLIGELVGRGVVVSIGHTNASYEQTQSAIGCGATYATHVFNAMARLDHRAPGPIAALLEDDRVTIGLIPDGLHVHPAVVRLVWRLVGAARISVVTDAMAALGMPPGRFRLAGSDVDVGADGSARIEGRLAGSTIGLDAAVRNLMAFTGATSAEAIATVTTVPRRLLRLDG